MTRGVTAASVSDRAISTVLDAAIFLLLVSAAVGLLYTVPQSDDGPKPGPDVAAETATTLATTIETIEYAPAPGGDRGDPGRTRSDRGTIAELLAETTVANARLEGEPFARAPNHEAAVRNATLRAMRNAGPDVRMQVRTTWRPLEGSGLRGGIIVGPSPPDDADVHAATTAVPVGTATSTGPTATHWSPGDARRTTGTLDDVAAADGCSGLGRVLADRVLGSLFPPNPTQQALRAGGEPARLTRDRYRTTADALGVDAGGFDDGMATRRRNELLASELATSFSVICRGGYDSPSDAVEHAEPGVVLVSVRTWSP